MTKSSGFTTKEALDILLEVNPVRHCLRKTSLLKTSSDTGINIHRHVEESNGFLRQSPTNRKGFHNKSSSKTKYTTFEALSKILADTSCERPPKKNKILPKSPTNLKNGDSISPQHSKPDNNHEEETPNKFKNFYGAQQQNRRDTDLEPPGCDVTCFNKENIPESNSPCQRVVRFADDNDIFEMEGQTHKRRFDLTEETGLGRQPAASKGILKCTSTPSPPPRKLARVQRSAPTNLQQTKNGDDTDYGRRFSRGRRMLKFSAERRRLLAEGLNDRNCGRTAPLPSSAGRRRLTYKLTSHGQFSIEVTPAAAAALTRPVSSSSPVTLSKEPSDADRTTVKLKNCSEVKKPNGLTTQRANQMLETLDCPEETSVMPSSQPKKLTNTGHQEVEGRKATAGDKEVAEKVPVTPETLNNNDKAADNRPPETKPENADNTNEETTPRGFSAFRSDLYDAAFGDLLHFKGWKTERVQQRFDDGSRIVLILPSDRPFVQRKVSDILSVVNAELCGRSRCLSSPPSSSFSTFSPPPVPAPHPPPHDSDRDVLGTDGGSTRNTEGGGNYTLLYVSSQSSVVGVCVGCRIFQAYPAIVPASPCKAEGITQTGGAGTGAVTCCDTGRPFSGALCGVSRVWVHRDHRRRQIATHLLDCLRCGTLYHGVVLDRSHIAFSDPTESGTRLARSYSGKREGFLVYTEAKSLDHTGFHNGANNCTSKGTITSTTCRYAANVSGSDFRPRQSNCDYDNDDDGKPLARLVASPVSLA